MELERLNRREILDDAIAVTMGDRQDDYGNVVDCHQRIAQIWSGILGHEVSARQVALCMAGVKMVRSDTSPLTADHYIDGAAYFAIAGEVEGAESR